ncbi:MAG: type IV pilus biogenesis/stability protein PilW [Gammaproteobacteria bacterium]|jgi:type IV pilus assembly protein PilF|nr:type IV pilus biogenesis/stability protein PilW [Gammaproteobacteria bacterium]
MKRCGLSIATLIVFALALAGCATQPVESDSSGRTGLDRVSPVRAADVNTRLGVGYLERGDLQLAMEKLQRAIEFDAAHVPAHVTLALVQERLGREVRARQSYREAVRLAPEDGGTLNSYAAFLCRQGEHRQAEEYFSRAVADPFYETKEVAHTNAGACAIQSRNHDRAEEHLRAALAINAEYPDALYHLANLYYQRDDAFRARAFLQRFEAVSGDDPAALSLGYRIERRLDNEREAARYLERLESRFPDSAQARDIRRLTSQDD